VSKDRGAGADVEEVGDVLGAAAKDVLGFNNLGDVEAGRW